ncbi:MAG: hypothetical protein DRR19_06135 [Candidatus Parabeggiatoa sp. nov. 1]|nr:MAG: hypothetical protein DRR19_06135 [Gammaproteobacteria bacterium]
MSLLNSLGEEQIYNFKHIGNFGLFSCGKSFPVEYILVSLSLAELFQLTFARDVYPDKINFELLMQRDIDEERVRLEMEPYLNPNVNQFTEGAIQSRTVYFPPLLAAMVPTKGNVMENYYTDEIGDIVTVNTNGQKTIKHIIREWRGLFKLTYLASHQPDAYRLQLERPNEITEVGVQCEPVQLEICLASGTKNGVKLVIIDGQHRLFTLQKVHEKYPDRLKNIRMPVCILFTPDATLKKNQAYAPARVPTVPEVFRRLFVDINSTAKAVSGHFDVLLSDNSISSLTCRLFCDYVFQQRGKEGLAAIEWNIKSKRESNQILRPYTLTGVGILGKALDDCIAPRKWLIKYLLKFDEVADALELVSGENDAPSDSLQIPWHKFSVSQKSLLEAQLGKYLVPCLDLLLFESSEFAKAFDIYSRHLNKIKSLATSQLPEALDARAVMNHILDDIPINEGKQFKSARVIYRNFESAVKQEKSEQVSTLIQYALFQRALFDAWAQVLEIARLEVPVPYHATQGFVKLLEFAFRDKGAFFHVEQPYMQHIVFSGNRFFVREETRKVLVCLIIAHLANEFYTEQVLGEMHIIDTGAKKLALNLQNKGQTAVFTMAKLYETAIKRRFSANYRVDFSLSSRERDELIEAEEEHKRHRQEVKKGTRLKTEISQRFEQLVENYVKASVDPAMAAFKNNLFKFKTDTLPKRGSI